MRNIIIAILITAVAVGGIGFYVGTEYASRNNVQIVSGQGQSGGVNSGRIRRNGADAGSGQGGVFLTGEVIAQDDKSVTIKLRDGGSKIVFISARTSVTKSVSGSIEDLLTGKQVLVSGSANADGSVTAQSVQIRPQAANSQ